MQDWSVAVELAARNVSNDAWDDLFERLVPYCGSVGEAPNGNVSARVSVEAETAQGAFGAAVRAVTSAAASCNIESTVLGVELITAEELDRQLAE